jgi:hypothetical protein
MFTNNVMLYHTRACRNVLKVTCAHSLYTSSKIFTTSGEFNSTEKATPKTKLPAKVPAVYCLVPQTAMPEDCEPKSRRITDHV